MALRPRRAPPRIAPVKPPAEASGGGRRVRRSAACTLATVTLPDTRWGGLRRGTGAVPATWISPGFVHSRHFSLLRGYKRQANSSLLRLPWHPWPRKLGLLPSPPSSHRRAAVTGLLVRWYGTKKEVHYQREGSATLPWSLVPCRALAAGSLPRLTARAAACRAQKCAQQHSSTAAQQQHANIRPLLCCACVAEHSSGMHKAQRYCQALACRSVRTRSKPNRCLMYNRSVIGTVSV